MTAGKYASAVLAIHQHMSATRVGTREFQMTKKILLVFGTRPEAIKMAPLVKALQAQPAFEVGVCVTAQHRHMLDQVLHLFDIQPDFDLNLMKPGQDLYDITSGVLLGLKSVLTEWRPDAVLVHGDTSTTFAATLAQWHFAPTATSRSNLLREAVEAGTVRLAGTNADEIAGQASLLLGNTEAYEAMAFAHNPYGDGFACERIAQTLLADKQLFAHAAGQPCRPASSMAVQS